MIMSSSLSTTDTNEVLGQYKHRYPSFDTDPSILTKIYDDEVNIAVWQRRLSPGLEHSVAQLLLDKPSLRSVISLAPTNATSVIEAELGLDRDTELTKNIAELVEMFCLLFDLKRVGLRLSALDRAMCPKFHVDRVPCRLVTTYSGNATEWIAHDKVRRQKLGKGSKGLSDYESGLINDRRDIQHLGCGDVALLKGEQWHGNENAGLVHRSPSLCPGERRLLLTLDFCD